MFSTLSTTFQKTPVPFSLELLSPHLLENSCAWKDFLGFLASKFWSCGHSDLQSLFLYLLLFSKNHHPLTHSIFFNHKASEYILDTKTWRGKQIHLCSLCMIWKTNARPKSNYPKLSTKMSINLHKPVTCFQKESFWVTVHSSTQRRKK